MKGGWGGGGGGGLYKLYRYLSPQMVWFLRHLGLKKGMDFAHFCLNRVLVFEGTTGVYELILHLSSK